MTSRHPFGRCRLTTYRDGRPTGQRRGLYVLDIPDIGRALILYSGEIRRRITTSPVVRVFRDPTRGRTYVQTRNTVYLLEHDTR